jgi:uncharacterized protein (TIGR02452 family)
MIKTHGENVRGNNKKIAEETIQILNQGYYDIHDDRYKIKEIVDWAIKNSQHLSPDELKELFRQDYRSDYDTNIVVSNVDTFTAARELERPVCLNFASGKHPGGGFLRGAQAQEECLARASSLFPTISQMSDMYSAHRKKGAPFYTSHMTYSPGVLDFRDEHDNLTDNPFKVAIITSPATNIRNTKNNTDEFIKLIEVKMLTRAAYVLTIAAFYGHKDLVLGAWGSGVFGLPPGMIPNIFKYLLDTSFHGTFENIIFAILDSSKDEKYIGPFKKVFGEINC